MEISRGAEAVLSRNDKELVKDRVRKGYRIQELDEKIRKERTKMESNLLNEARRAGVNTPNVISVEGNTIKMEFIDGSRLKELINSGSADNENIAKMIGISIAKLHLAGIIHGDLTTSNMILKGKLYLIDFGLGFFSRKEEDQATDLAVLYEALQSTHFKDLNSLWQNIVKGYGTYDNSATVLKRLETIQKRGRYQKVR